MNNLNMIKPLYYYFKAGGWVWVFLLLISVFCRSALIETMSGFVLFCLYPFVSSI